MFSGFKRNSARTAHAVPIGNKAAVHAACLWSHLKVEWYFQRTALFP